jgi:medium-chain acyl-[acyl-carrier-protein] hydrolase
MPAVSPNLWVTRPSPSANVTKRLFCLPFAGGGASAYRSWATYFGQTLEVCPIQLPGREGRIFEPAFTQVDALVAALTQHLSPFLDRPYALYGHSMGALIAFELAQAIANDDRLPNPERIFVAAHRAPQLPLQRAPLSDLSAEAFVDKLKQYGGFDDEILNNAEMMELLLPTLRADFTLCESYQYKPSPKLQYPIHVFAGVEDQQTAVESTYAWDQHSDVSVDSTLFTGGHFFLNSCQQDVLKKIRQTLLST